MLRVIGAVMVIAGAGSFGISRAAQLYKTARQLRELNTAVEMISCEMNYTLLPLPELYHGVGDRLNGAVSQFFRLLGNQLEQGIPRARAARRAMELTTHLCLPNDAKMALLELCETLGRYDMDGENRMLRLSGQRIAAALERCEAEKRPLARSCAALGISAGIALAILML